jgi:hypothetical protein
LTGKRKAKAKKRNVFRHVQKQILFRRSNIELERHFHIISLEPSYTNDRFKQYIKRKLQTTVLQHDDKRRLHPTNKKKKPASNESITVDSAG